VSSASATYECCFKVKTTGFMWFKVRCA